MAELGNRRTYSIIGRNDGVNDHQKTIFASDKSIAAIICRFIFLMLNKSSVIQIAF